MRSESGEENEEERLRQEVEDLGNRVTEKNAEIGKLKDILNEARYHIRAMKKEGCEDLKQIEALTEENGELKVRMKQNLEKIENLDSQVATLKSRNQMEESLNEKLKIEKQRLQENVETAHETIGKGLSKIRDKDSEIRDKDSEIRDKDSEIRDKDSEIRDKDSNIRDKDSEIHDKDVEIANLEMTISKFFEKEQDFGAKQSRIENLEKILEEKERSLNELESAMAVCECSFKISEQQAEMKACYAELDKKDKCLESLEKTLKEVEMDRSNIMRKCNDLAIEKQTDKQTIQSKEFEIQSLRISQNSAGILENKLKSDLNLCVQEKLEHLRTADNLYVEVATLRASEEKQKAEIERLKQIVTEKEKNAENLLEVIRERGNLKGG